MVCSQLWDWSWWFKCIFWINWCCVWNHSPHYCQHNNKQGFRLAWIISTLCHHLKRCRDRAPRLVVRRFWHRGHSLCDAHQPPKRPWSVCSHYKIKGCKTMNTFFLNPPQWDFVFWIFESLGPLKRALSVHSFHVIQMCGVSAGSEYTASNSRSCTTSLHLWGLANLTGSYATVRTSLIFNSKNILVLVTLNIPLFLPSVATANTVGLGQWTNYLRVLIIPGDAYKLVVR